MKNATEFAKKFKKFRRKLPTADAVTSDHGVIGEVIYSHMLWNATAKQASAASKKLIDAAVDLNDLRMNNVFEIVDLIGINYPQANERAKRLRSVINAIYKREHGVHVDSLDGVGKRDIREYFDSLDGITPFVCNRVISICFEVSAIPVDDRTLAVMIANDLVHETSTVSDVASWLSRQVRANESLEVHVRLHAWVETQPVPKKIKPVKKKSTKKKSAKTSSTQKKAPPKTKSTKKKVATKTDSKKKTTKKKVVKRPVAKKKVTKKKVAKKKARKKK